MGLSMKVEIKKAKSYREIIIGAADIFTCFQQVLPTCPDARILLKPNLNANMNALTGNTTDLRLIAAVIAYLKDAGYRNITIGEGTNSGYYRNRISVISRLKVDSLARYFGVKVHDLNEDSPHFVQFEKGIQAGVAEACFQSDFMINLPKIKTHFEVGMSVCLKNLIGCLVGQENKKKTHQDLVRNIIHLNRQLKPDLHIIDGLIAMEGLGPTRGRPLNMGLVIGGTDPYLLDLLCARLAGFDHRSILTLKIAESIGLIGPSHFEYLNGLVLDGFRRNFEPPKASFPASFIHSPKRQKYFLAVRNTRFFSWLAATGLFGHLLFLTGLRQDNFIKQEMVLHRLSVQTDRCEPGCNKCQDYCPIGLDVPVALSERDSRCIACLYCYLVCPKKAIVFDGELGFMAEQMRQYDAQTRKIA
jgi:uncharacterized protein (DUF362 family)/ferredoxin